MAAELVNAATSDKLTEMDWMKSIEICESVARDDRQARDVIKAIKNRVGSKNRSTQLFAVMLLEVLMNNIGEPVHLQVIDTGLLHLLVKIVKKKSDNPVREKIFLLLDATQTSLGGASGKFPQYYSAYYDLVSTGVQFPQRPEPVPKGLSGSNMSKNSSENSSLGLSGNERNAQHLGAQYAAEARPGHERNAATAVPPVATESSIIEKAGAALEVLRQVLDAVDARHPEEARDEFTLDLVEQCSFQKQRVMHLAITSRDEKAISQAVELNEQLQKALSRHDALISGQPTSSVDQVVQEEMEEEEAEQLFRRMRKGKACARSVDKDGETERHPSVPLERLQHRPLIRPVSEVEPRPEHTTARPAVSIPPPPGKHLEREKFFKEKKMDDTSLASHARGFSIHSRNGSSSRSESFDFSD